MGRVTQRETDRKIVQPLVLLSCSQQPGWSRLEQSWSPIHFSRMAGRAPVQDQSRIHCFSDALEGSWNCKQCSPDSASMWCRRWDSNDIIHRGFLPCVPHTSDMSKSDGARIVAQVKPVLMMPTWVPS